ncbi:gluconokinase-like isoform X2 [Primulina tabacum]|uniref:gluconokinase-like isoform X2 n=1 Tax=Primulina tabacum TaxID=48773 RepID=UPI003F591CC8
MTSDTGVAIVIMGVSGVGKSTIGKMLAKSLNGCFIDADDYHPQFNKDEDRIPWIETLRDALIARSVNGGTVILGCSALKESYREILRHADARYVRGSYMCSVKFVLLEVGAGILGARLEKRAAEGQHFMPAKLLESQLDLLQIDEAEGILRVDASQDPQTTLKNIQTLIGS